LPRRGRSHDRPAADARAGAAEKAKRVQARLREQGIVGVPEVLLLSACFDLYAKVEPLEQRLAA